MKLRPIQEPKAKSVEYMNSLKGQTNVILMHFCSSCKSLLTSFRDIVQRVADTMIIIGFFQPADAMAVREQFEEMDIMSGPRTEPDSCV